MHTSIFSAGFLIWVLLSKPHACCKKVGELNLKNMKIQKLELGKMEIKTIATLEMKQIKGGGGEIPPEDQLEPGTFDGFWGGKATELVHGAIGSALAVAISKK